MQSLVPQRAGISLKLTEKTLGFGQPKPLFEPVGIPDADNRLIVDTPVILQVAIA